MMKIKYILTFFALTTAFAEDVSFKSRISSLPFDKQTQIKKYAWHPNCPISLNNLAYIELTYWGYDHQPHRGILIVNKTLAIEVVAIFKILYERRFPIQRMEPIEVFKGNDMAAMKANNTAAYHCRPITGKVGIFSQHSYGRAIDINPLVNPYQKGNIILPPNGDIFLNRDQSYPGKIVRGDEVYREFKKYGWKWGGDWSTLKDYQHFEKPVRHR